MIEFSLKLTGESSSIGREDLELLKQHGFTEDQVIDIVLINLLFQFHGSVG